MAPDANVAASKFNDIKSIAHVLFLFYMNKAPCLLLRRNPLITASLAICQVG